MKLKEFDILLDIKRNKKVEEFEIVQGDYETNILKISLVEDFNEYELSGLDIEIAFAKSDGTTVLQDLNNGIELIGNKIVCTLKTNTIASPGKVLAEVRILEGLKLLTSSRFSFFVRQSIVNDKTIESTNEFPILNQLITDVTGLLDEIQSKPEIQGYSAYQIWLNEGNIGTVDDYLSSLIGETGPPGPQGEPGVQGERGPTGSIENLDSNNITEALGYTPADDNLIGLLASLTTEQKANLVAAINEIDDNIKTHKAESASLTKKGHVQLTSTSSNSESLAITPKALHDVRTMLNSRGVDNPVVIIGGTDLNTIVKKGFYLYSSGNALINSPMTGAIYLTVLNRIEEDLVIQIANRTYQNRIFIRSRSGTSVDSVWNDWEEFATNRSIPWINATLENGWTGTLQYRKNAIGQLEIRFYNVKAGIVNEGTVVFTIGEDFKPSGTTILRLYNSTAIKVGGALIVSGNSGEVLVRSDIPFIENHIYNGSYVLPRS